MILCVLLGTNYIAADMTSIYVTSCALNVNLIDFRFWRTGEDCHSQNGSTRIGCLSSGELKYM